jgi:serine/threonine-protein kinase
MATRKLGESDAVKIGVDICSALQLLAKNKTLHRNIKPRNILFSSGDFQLGDIGIARRLECAMLGISKQSEYNYMSPEAYKRQK